MNGNDIVRCLHDPAIRDRARNERTMEKGFRARALLFAECPLRGGHPALNFDHRLLVVSTSDFADKRGEGEVTLSWYRFTESPPPTHTHRPPGLLARAVLDSSPFTLFQDTAYQLASQHHCLYIKKKKRAGCSESVREAECERV